MLLHTPKNGASLLSLTLLLYLTDPALVVRYYDAQLAAGAYPANADAIAIPIAAYLVEWIARAPFLILLLWLALKSYRGRAPLLAFDRGRPLWSGAWTVALGFFAGLNLLMAANSFVEWGDYLYAASYLLWAYAVLCLRASITYAVPFAR